MCIMLLGVGVEGGSDCAPSTEMDRNNPGILCPLSSVSCTLGQVSL